MREFKQETHLFDVMAMARLGVKTQANPTQALFLVVIFRGQERFLVAPVFPRAGVSVWFSMLSG